MKVKLLNDILPWKTNMKILEELATHHWFIAYDNTKNPLKKIIIGDWQEYKNKNRIINY